MRSVYLLKHWRASCAILIKTMYLQCSNTETNSTIDVVHFSVQKDEIKRHSDASIGCEVNE